jgi:hypothetical protein
MSLLLETHTIWSVNRFVSCSEEQVGPRPTPHV